MAIRDMADTQETQDGVCHFYLEGVEVHRGELHAVFRCYWEGKELVSIGIKKGKNIKIKEYVYLTVVDIEKVADQVLILHNPPRSSAKVSIMIDGAPAPGCPPVMTVKVGQNVTVQSMRRALEAGGVNVRRH